MTELQLEPSAHAPWTRTMFGRVVISVVPSKVELKVTVELTVELKGASVKSMAVET
jgi:hypothetical protein